MKQRWDPIIRINLQEVWSLLLPQIGTDVGIVVYWSFVLGSGFSKRFQERSDLSNLRGRSGEEVELGYSLIELGKEE
jgi:hypothetical protein